MTEEYYVCYNNNCGFRTDDQLEYEDHGSIFHPHKPCYPGIADIELYGWKAQGKEWEALVNRKEEIQDYIDKGVTNKKTKKEDNNVQIEWADLG